MHDGTMEAVFDGKPFKNHELSAVYIYDEPVKDSDFKLQEEEVESVRWIDFDECKNKLWTGEIRNCIFESEFKMLEKQSADDVQQFRLNCRNRRKGQKK